MAKINDVYGFLKRLAPLELAESYDNPGLLVGNGKLPVTRALVALDITEKICDEAVKKDVQLIISHHPAIFHPLKSVMRNGEGAIAWNLASRSLSAICMHTNLDTAAGGVNDALCSAVGLSHTQILLPTRSVAYKKIIVFVPKGYEQKVKDAMNDAGAGNYGLYDCCTFEAPGTGSFRALEGADPFIGSVGKTEHTGETKIEAVCEPEKVSAVIAAMKAAHPYEVPAYDIYDDGGITLDYGIGRIAKLPREKPLRPFALFIKEKLNAPGIRVCDAGCPVKKAAVCSGAWDAELTRAAADAGADTVLTGEIKHSDMLEVLSLGLNVVAAGHFPTENVICPVLTQKLSAAFPQVKFEIAENNVFPEYDV